MSKGRNPGEGGLICAASYLDEVREGTPTALFKQSKRLGVYQWPDVLQIAKGDPNARILALRFSGTELLATPIQLTDYRRIVSEEMGRNPQLASPDQITEHCFFRLYRRGMGLGVSNDTHGQDAPGNSSVDKA
jgi:hypothetical protein